MPAVLPFDGYGRVSRVGDRGERLRSFEFQEREVRAEAEKRSLGFGEFIIDEDYSGATDKRPGLLRVIERIERGVSGGLIVAKLDRFSRDELQALQLADRIARAGGRIYSYAESADRTTPEGEFQVGITFLVAQLEHRRKAAEFEKSKAAAIAAGIAVNPRLAPGVRRRDDRRLEPDPDVAPVIVRAFEARAAGAGPSDVGDMLERSGVPTSMGSTMWSKQAVYGLLSNRVYLGELRQGKHVNEMALEPIVDRALWEAAQRPDQRRRPTRSRLEHPDIGLGLLRCASCRYTLNATNSSRGRRVYRCPGRHAGGRCPGPARAYADEVDPLLERTFFAIAENWRARGSVTDSAAVDGLRAALGKAERALALYRDDADLEATVEAMGGMAAWREGLRIRRERVEAAALELAEAERDLVVPDVPQVTALRAEWPRIGARERRQHLATLIDCVALLPADGTAIARRVVVFRRGAGPTDLPRRGFRQRPTIRPFDLPASAGVRGL